MPKSMRPNTFKTNFLRLNPRFLIPIAALLAVIFLAIILVGIHENQSNMLRMLRREGSALLESISISAQNNIKASELVNQLVIDNLVDIAALVELSAGHNALESSRLSLICQMLGINRIDLVDSAGRIASSSFSAAIGKPYDESFLSRLPLQEVISGSAEVANFIMQAEDISSVDQLVAAVSSETRPGATVLFMNSRVLDSFNRRIGLGYMIRSIGSQPGIDYIFLQSQEGVVLSSRKLQPVLSISADSFLQNVIADGREDGRKIKFEGRPVLEICRPFYSEDFPSGVLRLGLSLEGFSQVARNFKVQMALLGGMLFLLTFLFVAIAMANQGYRSVAEAYEQFKTITSNILGGIENAVVAVDLEQRVILLNPTAEKLFALKAPEAIGKKYTELFPEDPLLINELLSAQQETIIKEIPFGGGKARNLTLMVTVSRLRSVAGETQGAVSIALDLTARKELELQAKQAERLSELGSLAAGVAHEIRNPLNAISIAAQRLKGEYKVTPDQAGFDKLVITIRSEIERLNMIVAEFLALARSGRLYKEKIILRDYLAEIVAFMAPEAEKQGARIMARLEGEAEAEIDPQEMKKVMVNLIKNAMEAAGKDGEIIVAFEG